MNDKTLKTEYAPLQEPSTYQTGSTKPPKSYMGLILVLLGLVIFLGGIVTVLGMNNIRLKVLLAKQETQTNAVAFSRSEDQPVVASAHPTGLGFSGETVPEFWHTYGNLPRGIFIQSVDPGTDAARQGVLPGDVLTHVNGHPITNLEALASLMNKVTADTVMVVLFRDEEQITLTLRLPAGAE